MLYRSPDENAVHCNHLMNKLQFQVLLAVLVCNLADMEEAFEFCPIDWKTMQWHPPKRLKLNGEIGLPLFQIIFLLTFYFTHVVIDIKYLGTAEIIHNQLKVSKRVLSKWSDTTSPQNKGATQTVLTIRINR